MKYRVIRSAGLITEPTVRHITDAWFDSFWRAKQYAEMIHDGLNHTYVFNDMDKPEHLIPAGYPRGMI